MKKMWGEFKDFINKGNAMDLAVGVVIGGAFTAIVTSIVNDLIKPLLSLITGGIDFSALKIPLGEGEDAAAFTYGNFIMAVISFILIALVVFFIVKGINKMRDAGKKKEKPAPEGPKEIPPTCPFCLEEVKEGATSCPHCGGEFEKPAAKTIVEPEAAEA